MNKTIRLVLPFFVAVPFGLLQANPQADKPSGKSESYDQETIQALRVKAERAIGLIPARMPGSEKDTPQKIELGRKLFFDPLLSDNQTMSCNSCHKVDQGLGGVDNLPTSPGTAGKRGDRNSPTVLNAGFHIAQFWDGRAATLEDQAKGPILNPIEMGMPDEKVVLQRLQEHAEYPDLFKKTFPSANPSITYDHVAQAIAAFERTLITRDRFDDFLKGEDQALSTAELKGLDLFLDKGCVACHNGPVLGGNSFQKFGLIHPYENTADLGRYLVTRNEDDKYRFKVPSLRNIALTGPYFHDGSARSLMAVVNKMAHTQLDKKLTAEEARSLVAFLNSLTDKDRAIKTISLSR